MKHRIKLTSQHLGRIGVREWGLPTLVMPGKIWRSKEKRTITCMLPSGRKAVRHDTRRYTIVDPGEQQWMPEAWRKAIWQYVKAYPFSGAELGPFLNITEEQRNSFLRDLGKKLVESDEIGCRGIAAAIGYLAEWEI